MRYHLRTHTAKLHLLSAILHLAAAASARAATWYVSTAGSDAAGTGTVDQPFRTVPRALGEAQPGDEVVLRGSPAVTPNEYQGPVRTSVADITVRSAEGVRLY